MTEARALLKQAREASELAEQAFASGHFAIGIAAVVLAAQLVQLARLWWRDD
jgi:hypothetical protein